MAGIFSRITTILDLFEGRGANVDGSSGYGNVFAVQSGRNDAGVSVTVDTLLEDSTVIAGLGAITNGISQVPMQVRRKTEMGSELLLQHPIQRLLERPNAYQTCSEFKEAVVTSILVHGNAFIRIIRVGGQPRQLIPMDPSEITVGATAMGLPSYNHNSFGKMSNEEVIQIRDVSTYTPQGESRLMLSAQRIGALKAADRLMSTTFRNGVSVNYAITTEGAISADERAAFAKALKDTFGQGGTGQGGAMVLPAGSSMNALKGTTPADADLRALRQDLIREIAAIFGVPAYMLGVSGDEKYNNVRQKTTSFHRDTLNPLMVKIQEAFTMKLLGDGEFIEFDVVDFVKGAVNEQAQVASQLVSAGIWTPNEGREYLGKNPSDQEHADMLIEPNSSSTESETVSETVESTGGEDGPQSLDNRPERDEANNG